MFMGAVDVERQQPERVAHEGARRRGAPGEPGSRTLKDAMNEALRDWVTNVPSVLLHRHGGRSASLSGDGARFPVGDRQRDARADAGGRRPAAGFADRLHRRRLERHGTVPSLPRRASNLRRRGGRPWARERPARGLDRRHSPASAWQAHLSAAGSTTARSRRRIRSRPVSIIRASGRARLAERHRPYQVSVGDRQGGAGRVPALQPARRHHPGARAMPCAWPGSPSSRRRSPRTT